ncbi:MAG: hypothetical protein ACO3N9_09905, partial [Alphaproteobacteria bacterium]
VFWAWAFKLEVPIPKLMVNGFLSVLTGAFARTVLLFAVFGLVFVFKRSLGLGAETTAFPDFTGLLGCTGGALLVSIFGSTVSLEDDLVTLMGVCFF